jgi:hypothetical protein
MAVSSIIYHKGDAFITFPLSLLKYTTFQLEIPINIHIVISAGVPFPPFLRKALEASIISRKLLPVLDFISSSLVRASEI